VRQIEINTAEPLVPQPSSSEVEIAIEKLKRYKSSCIDQIPIEPIQAGGGGVYYVLRYINSLIVFGIRKNCQSSGSDLLLYPFIRRAIKTDCNNLRGKSLL
jgi:hypothetical protein